MPPELLSGKPFSKAVDVFMFGILLWEVGVWNFVFGIKLLYYNTKLIPT